MKESKVFTLNIANIYKSPFSPFSVLGGLHRAKSSNAQEKSLIDNKGHVIKIRLKTHKADVVILTPETVDSIRI